MYLIDFQPGRKDSDIFITRPGRIAKIDIINHLKERLQLNILAWAMQSLETKNPAVLAGLILFPYGIVFNQIYIEVDLIFEVAPVDYKIEEAVFQYKFGCLKSFR